MDMGMALAHPYHQTTPPRCSHTSRRCGWPRNSLERESVAWEGLSPPPLASAQRSQTRRWAKRYRSCMGCPRCWGHLRYSTHLLVLSDICTPPSSNCFPRPPIITEPPLDTHIIPLSAPNLTTHIHKHQALTHIKLKQTLPAPTCPHLPSPVPASAELTCWSSASPLHP